MLAQEFSDIVNLALDNDPGIFISVVLCNFSSGKGLHVREWGYWKCNKREKLFEFPVGYLWMNNVNHVMSYSRGTKNKRKRNERKKQKHIYKIKLTCGRLRSFLKMMSMAL